MKLKARAHFEGIYSFAAVNANTGESRDLGSVSDSPNMIVKAGLNTMGNSDRLISQCVVGTNSTTVSFEDTSLGAQIASTTTVQSETYGAQGSAPYFRWYRRTYRFAQGAAAGNLAEVGVKSSNGALFSRALIVDSAGNPTTLTILSDEYLDVTYEFRTYIDIEDKVQQLTVNGVVYTATLRAANANSSNSYQDYGITNTWNSSYHQYFYSGYISGVTGSPGGSNYNHSRSVRGNYVNDSFERTFIFSAGLNYANFDGGIQSIYLQTTQGNFQVGFSPAIPKNNYMILTVDLTIAWGPYDT